MATRSNGAALPGGDARLGVTAGYGTDNTTDSNGRAGAPGFAVTVTTALRPFTIHNEVFDRWTAGKGDSLQRDLPNPAQKNPGAALSSLYDQAWAAGVIDADSGIELGVYGDFDRESSGYYVVLYDRGGDQQSLGITSGWNELTWPKSNAAPPESAREYLHQICSIANETLSMLPSPTC